MKVFIDLCSGLGGASEAFVNDAEWVVFRFENNPKLQDVACTFNNDILEWMDWLPIFVEAELGTADQVVVWASPTCRQFSDAFAAPKSIARRAGEDYEPNMDLFKACLDIIEFIEPDFWIIENVRGAIEFFEPEIGPYRQHIFSFFLWGNFPHIDIDPYQVHSKATDDVNNRRWDRMNIKAKIPYVVSNKLKVAIDGFTSLDQWI